MPTPVLHPSGSRSAVTRGLRHQWRSRRLSLYRSTGARDPKHDAVGTAASPVRVVLLAAIIGGTVGCLDELVPVVGEEQASSCSNEDSDAATPVDFQVDIVQRIFDRDITGCRYCHLPDAPIPIGFQVGQLDVTSYETLREGGLISRTGIVTPGRPCESILFQKVGEGVPFGARMPLNGPPYLADDELQLIHDWIAEGAEAQ